MCILTAIALLLGAGVFAYWQRENVGAVVLSKVMNQQSLSDRVERVRQENQQMLVEQGVTVPSLTQNQMEQLLKGKLTVEEAAQSLSLDQYQSGETAEDLINQCVAELYGYEAKLYEQLGVIRSEARALWRSYPKSERTSSLKHDIKMDCLSQCYQLESAADAQITAILERYRGEMEDLGGDPSQIDSLWSVYCSEKASVKAYYYKLIQHKEDKNQ